MNIKSMMKWNAVLLLLTSSFAAFAGDSSVTCPGDYWVRSQWQSLDSIQKQNTKNWYIVKTDTYSIFDDKNLLWWDIWTMVYASDFNTAFTSGQENVKNVDMQINKFAHESGTMPDYYTCIYKDTNTKQIVYLQAMNHHKNDNKLERYLSRMQA